MQTLLTLVTLISLGVPPTAMAIQTACPKSPVSVDAETQPMCQAVCDAVHSGETFLNALGLNLPDNLRILLYRELPKNGQQHSIGYYDPHNNAIRLLDYDTTLRISHESRPSFDVQMNPSIWRSYVIHELAHAAAQKSFTAGVPKGTASEYIAAVAQIATMPKDEFYKILQHYPELSGFDGKEEITMLFYLLDPSKFILNSYLHFSKPENGQKFIGRLLREGLSDN